MSRRHDGFSLVELMISVAIVAVLASVASMGFGSYKRRAQDSERAMMLSGLTKSMISYYHNPRGDQGVGATTGAHCRIGDPDTYGPWPPVPGPDQKMFVDFTTHEAFRVLGFEKQGWYYNNLTWFTHSSQPALDGGKCGVINADWMYVMVSGRFNMNGGVSACDLILHARDGEVVRDRVFCTDQWDPTVYE